jgi:NADH-quinone oxidoreductase subunit C
MSDDSQKPSDPGQPSQPSEPSPAITPPAGAGTSPSAVPAAKPTAPAARAATPPKPAPKPASAAGGGSGTAPKAAEHPPRAAAPAGPPDPPPPADKTPPAFIASLAAAVPGVVLHVSYWVGDWTIVVPAARILDAARHLRDAPEASFDMCSDVTATDWPPRAERFDLIYCLYSTRHRHRIRVKAKVAENAPVASVTGVWPAANWLEREVYDMFGVNFVGHPDRRRILMPEDWQGFPERKDYPLEGPGELLMENPLDWLKLTQARDQADIE